MRSLEDLGWTPFFDKAHQELISDSDEDLRPARVLSCDRTCIAFLGADGPGTASIPGRLLKAWKRAGEWPVVGDWALIAEGPRIAALLPRQSLLARTRPGDSDRRQNIAANIDDVVIVTSVLGDLNLRRLERYLLAVEDSGAEAVIAINKCDLLPETEDAAELADAIEERLDRVEIYPVSALNGEGIPELESRLRGRCAALVGSSGVGKSSLTNALLGEEAQETGGIRERDARGRHTTTRRALLAMPGGGWLIDTPGMRELQLWEIAGGLDRAFEDLVRIEQACRFRDCAHEQEPGCAVREAILDGALDPGRLQSRDKLRREQEFLSRKRRKLKRHESRAEHASARKRSRRDWRGEAEGLM